MTSQLQHILLNISQIKGNKAMKFGQLIKIYENMQKNEAGKLAPDHFLFF